MLLTLSLFGCSHECPAPWAGASPDSAEFRAFVEEHLDAIGAPGASVGLIRDGELVFAGGFGEASPGQAAEADTIWMLASISKLATAAAVHELAVRGGLGLDQPVNEILPFEVNHPRSDEPITARLLLEHESGLRDNERVIWGHYAPGDPTETLEHWLRDVLVPGGAHYDAGENFSADAPGESRAYCNTGFALAGMLVESAAEQPFDAFCDENIFGPLGMEDTAWMLADLPQQRVANPYERGAFGLRAQPHYGFPDYPDGQLRTTVGDFSSFLLMLSHGGVGEDGQQVLAPEAALALWQDGIGSKRELHGDWVLRGHGGSDDGVHTQAWLSEDGELGFLLFMNRRVFSDEQRAARGCLERGLIAAAEAI